MPIRVVIADDHPIVLDGLERLFQADRDFSVVARCTDGEEALRAAHEHQPDVLVLDIRMPKRDGIGVLREVRKAQLATRVVLLTGEVEDDVVVEAMRLGARGIVLKEMAPAMLVQCVRKVHAGDQWIERRSFGRALDKMLRREAGAREAASTLTPREIAITRMIGSGLRNKEIADKLSISEGTVKIHLHHIYEKLGLDGRVALSLYARDKGLA